MSSNDTLQTGTGPIIKGNCKNNKCPNQNVVLANDGRCLSCANAGIHNKHNLSYSNLGLS
jgi:hypothetical protein